MSDRVGWRLVDFRPVAVPGWRVALLRPDKGFDVEPIAGYLIRDEYEVDHLDVQTLNGYRDISPAIVDGDGELQAVGDLQGSWYVLSPNDEFDEADEAKERARMANRGKCLAERPEQGDPR